jgi:hypothetical protein
LSFFLIPLFIIFTHGVLSKVFRVLLSFLRRPFYSFLYYIPLLSSCLLFICSIIVPLVVLSSVFIVYYLSLVVLPSVPLIYYLFLWRPSFLKFPLLNSPPLVFFLLISLLYFFFSGFLLSVYSVISFIVLLSFPLSLCSTTVSSAVFSLTSLFYFLLFLRLSPSFLCSIVLFSSVLVSSLMSLLLQSSVLLLLFVSFFTDLFHLF